MLHQGGPLRPIPDDQQANARTLLCQQGKCLNQMGQAMPGLESADEPDREAPRAGGTNSRKVWPKTLGVYSIGDDLYSAASAWKLLQVGSNHLRNGNQGRGGPANPLGNPLGRGTVDQTTQFLLLLDQRRIDFQQAGHSRSLGILHPSKTPEGIALVDAIERALLVQGSGQAVVRGQAGHFAAGAIALALHRHEMKADIRPSGGLAALQ